MTRLAEIILAGTVLPFGAKIIVGKFSNIKNKMLDKIKLEAMKIMSTITSISMELQNMLLIFISRRKTIENLLLQSNIKKRNYYLGKVIKAYLEILNRRP